LRSDLVFLIFRSLVLHTLGHVPILRTTGL
jgi:hypothetical protein